MLPTNAVSARQELVPDDTIRQIFKILAPYTAADNWAKVINDYNKFWREYDSKWGNQPTKEMVSLDTLREFEIPPPLDLSTLNLGQTLEHDAVIDSLGLQRANLEPTTDSVEAP